MGKSPDEQPLLAAYKLRLTKLTLVPITGQLLSALYVISFSPIALWLRKTKLTKPNHPKRPKSLGLSCELRLHIHNFHTYLVTLKQDVQENQ